MLGITDAQKHDFLHKHVHTSKTKKTHLISTIVKLLIFQGFGQLVVSTISQLCHVNNNYQLGDLSVQRYFWLISIQLTGQSISDQGAINSLLKARMIASPC